MWSFTFVIMGVGIILGNWVSIIRTKLTKKFHSQVGLIGGVFGCVGLLISDSESLKSYAWIPLVLDPGCALLLVSLLFRRRHSA